MLKKIKEYISLCIIGGAILSLSPDLSRAQEMQYSPLSRFGYGVMADPTPIAYRGMGGTGIALSGSRIINLKNPAAYAATDSMSFLMDFGGSMILSLQRDTQAQKASLLGGLDYVAMQFPVYRNRIALSLGAVPFSRTGYGLSTLEAVTNGDESSTNSQVYAGSGTLQSAYVGVAGKVTQNLYLGTNLHYLFGTLSHTYTISPSDIYSSRSSRVYDMRMGNIYMDLGAQYRIKLSQLTSENITLGLTYRPKFALTPTLTYTINKSNSTAGSNIRADIESKSEKQYTALPEKWGAGIAWNKSEKVTIALDASMSRWSAVPNIFSNDGVQLLDSYEASLGAEIKPTPFSRNYGRMMSYRFGVNYQTSYLQLPKIGRTHTMSAALGLGLPVDIYSTDRPSIIHITLEYQRTMSLQSQAFSEDMIKLSLGLTFNETWFRKLKIY